MLLLYLTGGISNPFSLLLIVPAIVSSTFLSMGTTIILGFSYTTSFTIQLTKYYLPLPGVMAEYVSLNFPIILFVWNINFDNSWINFFKLFWH